MKYIRSCIYTVILPTPVATHTYITSIIVSTRERHSHLFATNIANYMHVTPHHITNDIPVLRLFYILTPLITKGIRINDAVELNSSINALTLTPPQLHHCVSVYVTSSCLVCCNLNNNIHTFYWCVSTSNCAS